MTKLTTAELLAQFRAGQRPPAAALRLSEGDAATVTTGEGADGKSIKVHLKARSRAGINHWYWGQIVHDFGTMKAPAKIAMDDSHCEEIGYARPQLTDYGLECDGVVVPNDANPDHESNRIAYNLKNGIPQQASIDWSGEYDLLEVPKGFSLPVNGLPVTGPALVVQNWSLRAVAVCKNGADPSTLTECQTFSADHADAAQAPRNISTATATPPAAVEAPAQASAEAVAVPPAVVEPPPVTPPPAEAAIPAAVEAQAAPQPPAPDHAAEVTRLTAEGAELRAQLEAEKANGAKLAAEVATLTQRVQQLAGGVPPVPASKQSDGKSLWQQYNEISDPAEKTRFYRAHRAEMNKPNAS